MLTETQEGRQLLAQLSKDLVSEIAPNELEHFDELLSNYYKHPPGKIHSNDDQMGFGGSIMVAATPVLAMALNGAVEYLITEVIKSAKAESAAIIAEKVKGFFIREKESQRQELSLSKEQLTTLKEIVKKELRRGGMNLKKSEDTALKIIARLAVRA